MEPVFSVPDMKMCFYKHANYTFLTPKKPIQAHITENTSYRLEFNTISETFLRKQICLTRRFKMKTCLKKIIQFTP